MLTNDNHHVTPAGSIGEETLLRNVTCARLTPTQPHVDFLTYLSPKRVLQEISEIAPQQETREKAGWRNSEDHLRRADTAFRAPWGAPGHQSLRRPISEETNLLGDQFLRRPISEETNYWVPAWLDGAPGHECIGWEMQSATKLVPQSTFSNYSERAV